MEHFDYEIAGKGNFRNYKANYLTYKFPNSKIFNMHKINALLLA